MTILDDFFENPDAVRDFALQQTYTPSDDGRWPGLRTAPLNTIHPEFFSQFCSRVLSLFYSNYDSICYADVTFQKMPNGLNEGWIHADTDIITVIVYLNENSNLSSGTSIYRNKKINLVASTKHNNIKCDFYKSKCDVETAQNYRNLNNQQFEETIKISNVYNRLLAFDSQEWHGAQSLDANNNEERLTLIGFFNKLDANGPVRRCHQLR